VVIYTYMRSAGHVAWAGFSCLALPTEVVLLL
jgi:hypothetical protein